MSIDRSGIREDEWLETMSFSTDRAREQETKSLFERLRDWSGFRYVAAFVLMGQMSAASREESLDTIVETGARISESVERAASVHLDVSDAELLREAYRDPDKFLHRAESTPGFRISPELLRGIAESDPQNYLIYHENFEKYSDRESVRKMAAVAILEDPQNVISQDPNSDPYTREILQSGTSAELVALRGIVDSPHTVRERMRMSSLLDLVHSGGMTVEQSFELSEDHRAFANALIRVNAKDEYLAKNSVAAELYIFSHEMLHPVNELHDKPDGIRMSSLDGKTPAELYTALAYFGNEAYPSTYNKTLTKLIGELGASETTGDQLLEEVGDAKFREFVRSMIEHHRIDDFLATMSAPAREKMMRTFVESLDGQGDMVGQAAMVADALRNIEDPHLRFVMTKSIQSEYGRVSATGNAEATVVYGVLSNVVDADASWVPADRMPDYRLSVSREISPDTLRNADGKVVERYFFYDDLDGESSFGHFLSRFKGKSGWKVESHREYVVVKSTGEGNGIVIYANRPKFEVSGDTESEDAIEKIMAADGMDATVAVHRGHVYHQQKTIARLGQGTKIFFNGGCSGFDATKSVLKVAPEAHIISNQGTGTMLVNDTLLGMLERDLRGDAIIVWDSFFDRAGTKLASDEHFPLYVSPSKNFASQFLVAYEKAMKAYGTKPDIGLLSASRI